METKTMTEMEQVIKSKVPNYVRGRRTKVDVQKLYNQVLEVFPQADLKNEEVAE